MHVQLLFPEAIRLPAAWQIPDLRAQHVAVEGIGASGIGDRDHRVIEPQPRGRAYTEPRASAAERP